MQDDLNFFQRTSLKVQDFQQDLLSIWQDEAAREVRGRYLIPHGDRDEAAHQSLNRQLQSLTSLKSQVQTAKSHAQRANEYSEQVADHLERSTQEAEKADRYQMDSQQASHMSQKNAEHTAVLMRQVVL